MKNDPNASGKIDFTGFDNWVEIFTGGKQIDSAGTSHDGDRLIKKAVETFDPSYHEPPAVVGHPTHDAPAYGWVESVKADMKNGVQRLYAKFRQVVPEFEEMVKSGQFKKRSASFYPDGRLRHVGWLGAMPPAVKGLSDVAFSADDQAIDFDITHTITPNEEKKKMNFSDFMEAMKFWKKIQDDPDAEVPLFTAPKTVRPDTGATFSEADMETAKKEAAEAAKQAAENAVRAEFAEKETSSKVAAARAKIQVLIDDGVKAGTIAPAWKDAGLAEFMESLDVQKPIAFGEGDAKAERTGLDWFCDFLEGLPKLVDFSEIATRDKDVKGGNAGARLEALVKKRMTENRELGYSAAFSEVMSEHPALATEYSQEIHN